MLKITDPRTYSLLCLLMDHKEGLTEARRKRYKRISEVIRNHWNFGKDFTEEEVFRVLGILSVNSFCVHDGIEDNTGLIGLYPWTSLMSHCCVPNIKIVTKPDFSYIVESLVDIPKGSIRIKYFCERGEMREMRRWNYASARTTELQLRLDVSNLPNLPKL